MKKLIFILILGILLASITSFSVIADLENKNGNSVIAADDECSVDADCGADETCQDGECEDIEEDDEDDEEENTGLGEVIRNKVKAGIYTSEEGEEIRVSEMARNRTRLRTDSIEAETELEIEEETEEDEKMKNKTKLKVKLSNGRKAEIKIMPDAASERALERLRLKVCSAENNCTIELKEVGKKNQTGEERRLAYEVQAERHMRILGLFKTKAQVKAEIDAETGEIISVKKPWWAFLALESEE